MDGFISSMMSCGEANISIYDYLVKECRTPILHIVPQIQKGNILTH